MNFKKSVSALVLGSLLMTTLPMRKAEAGIVIAGASLTTGVIAIEGYKMYVIKSDRVVRPLISFQAHNALLLGGVSGFLIGGGIALGGAFSFNPVLMILSEDGSLAQDKLEGALTEKYSMISDREVISNLAKSIKTKADSMKADNEGKKLVSLTETEVRSILASADLEEDEIKQIVNDLK